MAMGDEYREMTWNEEWWIRGQGQGQGQAQEIPFWTRDAATPLEYASAVGGASESGNTAPSSFQTRRRRMTSRGRESTKQVSFRLMMATVVCVRVAKDRCLISRAVPWPAPNVNEKNTNAVLF